MPKGSHNTYNRVRKHILYKVPGNTWLPMTFHYGGMKAECLVANTDEYGVTFIFTHKGEEFVFCVHKDRTTIHRLHFAEFKNRIYYGIDIYSHLSFLNYPFAEEQPFLPK